MTIIMCVAVIYFGEYIRALEGYGYLGAFVISIFGGATIIIPVPMLAVVFALGGVMKYTWLVGISASIGETIGALTIYMTGHGAGAAINTRINNGNPGRLQSIYIKVMDFVKRRGGLAIFLVSSVVNPFFYPTALTAGATGFGVKKFIPICFAGKTIKAMTVSYAGYYGLKGLFQWLGITI